ncbi:Wadjet anti-phage system protein JetA family protein [Paenibacillus sp. GCM10028914]|uniref:Wadjet anti-phage system protein JetA family protein n=1 Tax=Paenibacillus sp. GCM10028914 TaxID=3273416 RepID=UPI0036207A96
MPLFDTIPDSFFSLLSSKHRHIYLRALFVVLECFQREITVRKDDLVSLLISSLEEQIYYYNGEENELLETNISERAHALLRKFRETGWLETEQTFNSFDEYFIIPDYSLKIITVLKDINDDQQKDYDSIVSSTYFTLRGVEQEKGEYAYDALVQTHRMTLELRDNLIRLLNNMRRYHLMVQDISEASGILQQHFDKYQEAVNERIYHPLKTFDSVDRFKVSITRILRSWMIDDPFIETMSSRSRNLNKASAQEEILHQINEIIDIYTIVLPRLVAEIDRKHNAYIRATVQRFQYLTNRDRDFKGRLVSLLNQSRNSKSMEFVNELQNLPFFRTEFISEESLFKRQKRRQPHEPDDMNDAAVDESLMKQEINELKEKAKRAITRKKVVQFIEQLLETKSEQFSSELAINDIDDFLSTIISVIISDEKDIPFDIEFLEGDVLINGYRIPNMLYKKVGGSH